MSKKEKYFPISTVGGRIQKRRHELNLSRHQLYDKVFKKGNARDDNGKNKTVLNWESSKTELNYDTLAAMCFALKCSADYLLGLDECTNKSVQFIHEYTGLSEKVIHVLHKMQGSQFGRRLRAALEILVLDVDKFNGGKYYKRFLELFSDYLQFSGDDSKRYSFSKNGEIKEEKPTHDEFGNEKYNKDHVYITSNSLKYMFIMEMEDSLKCLKKEYDKNHNFLD